jgi:hypothetical protein
VVDSLNERQAADALREKNVRNTEKNRSYRFEKLEVRKTDPKTSTKAAEQLGPENLSNWDFI